MHTNPHNGRDTHPPARPKNRALLTKALAAAAATAISLTAGFNAQAPTALANTFENDRYGSASAGHAHGLHVNLLNIGDDVLSTATARSSFEGNWSETGSGALDLTALGIDVSSLLGLQNLSLPLISTEAGAPALLDLGDLGLLGANSVSPSHTFSQSWSAVASQDGTVNLDPNSTSYVDFDPAKLDLSALLEQVLGAAGTAVLDEGSLSIGAVGSQMTADNGIFAPEYMVAGVEANLHSPLLDEVLTGVDTLLVGVGDTLNEAIGADGVIGQVVNSLPDINLGLLRVNLSGGTIALAGLDQALEDASNTLINEDLTDSNGIVRVNLGDGSIKVDLAKVVDGGDLNGLDPNTLLLDDVTLGKITTAVTEALGSVTTKVVTVVTDLVNNLELVVDLNLELRVLLEKIAGGAEIKVPLGVLTGAIAGDPVIDVQLAFEEGLLSIVLGLLGLADIGALLNLVTGPILSLVVDLLAPVVETLLTTITTALAPTLNGIVDPLLLTLSPVLALLNQVVQIVINEQPTTGDLGANSRTVRALSVELLPAASNVLKIELASASAISDAVANLIATPEHVAAGENVTVTGNGYLPGEIITVNFPDGTTLTTVADENGEIGADTAQPITWTVPADTPVGTANLTAIGSETNREGTAAITIVVPSLTATPESVALEGESVSFVGQGFVPNESVTIAVGSTTIATLTADSTGMIVLTNGWSATAADWTEDDTAEFTATGQESDRTASATVSITAPVSNADASASADANASASASASARADGDNNVAAQAAAVAAALADTTSGASARADASASAAARAAANTDASVDASADVSVDVSAAAQAAALAAANSDADSDAAAAASASADADASASAAVAANATASADASTVAAADADADVDADVNVDADATTDVNADGVGAVLVVAPDLAVLDETAVSFSGTGFIAGETVTVSVTLPNGDVVTVGTAVVDANGSFVLADAWVASSSEWAEGDVVTFTALGAQNGVAATASLNLVAAASQGVEPGDGADVIAVAGDTVLSKTGGVALGALTVAALLLLLAGAVLLVRSRRNQSV